VFSLPRDFALSTGVFGAHGRRTFSLAELITLVVVAGAVTGITRPAAGVITT